MRTALPRTFALIATLCVASLNSHAAADQPVVFTDVNVIPMDEDRVIENQTVLIADGVIERIGAADEVNIPDDARVVEAAGQYLMPGLSEMHAHVPGPGQYQEDTMFLYLANGVTIARSMAGNPSHLPLREKVATGEISGPRLISASPGYGGHLNTPSQGARQVREHAEAGYDLLKMFGGFSVETFDAIVEQAQRSNIDIAGHVPGNVGLHAALEAGFASIDHFDAYMPALVDPDETSDINPGFFGYRLAPYAQQELIEQIARETREADVWNVPTETIMYSAFILDLDEVREQRDEFQYMPQNVVDGWFNWVTNFRAGNDFDAEAGQQFVQVRLDLIKAMHDEGAGLLLGSDAPQWFNVPGFSVHYEIEVMGDAGLTPFEVLETGTVNPARYLGEEDVFGKVQEGMQADLILLNANPLDDLSHTSDIAGVLRQGRFYDRQTLDAELAEIAQRNAR